MILLPDPPSSSSSSSPPDPGAITAVAVPKETGQGEEEGELDQGLVDLVVFEDQLASQLLQDGHYLINIVAHSRSGSQVNSTEYSLCKSIDLRSLLILFAYE